MLIPQKIIDNSNITLASFLNEVLKTDPETNFDIATAFFNIQAYALLKENISGINRFRLLLGKAPEIKTDHTLGNELLKHIRTEVEGFELTKEKDSLVKEFIQFLKKDNVEIRIYDKDFLHGKAYILDKIVVVGSSNFTPSGLTHNTELNSVSLESEAHYTREKWFEKFWQEAKDFKGELIALLENSRFGTKEYTPYQVYIKSLYELQKEDIVSDAVELSRPDTPTSRVNLAEFQEDAVKRIFTRLKKYRSALVADSVGLGKTFIAKRVIEEFGFYKRRKFLVVCPAQLRGKWRAEIKDLILAESIISQEELASEEFLEKAKQALGGDDLAEASLVVVDESHNFRNPLSNRWEHLFTLLNDHIRKDGKRPYILFLTATPINNTIWDLYWQTMLLTLMNQATFMNDGIPDLSKFFKEIDKKEDPALLNDLMNELSVRRTRDYIKRNYPDAEIDGKKVIFPERELENINYRLDETYQRLYRSISETITEKLGMPYYRILEYKKEERLTPEDKMVLGRMIALEGIFRTILLKRLESSVEAFRKSILNHVDFLKRLKGYLNQGKFLTKETFNRYIVNLDEESLEDFSEKPEDFQKDHYRFNDLIKDIDTDIKLLEEMHRKVEGITPQKDAKLNSLKERLIELSEKGQVVVFTYYADTLNYIYDEIKKEPVLARLDIEKISGATTPKSREAIVKDFMEGSTRVLVSTDVLSEGMDLQSAQYLINYDLHWNPTRMIQRAGRIDRIGSPFHTIYVYNFFPEEELEELLRLVQVLQNKIRNIDASVGLDTTILGEEVHPKVFGIIRKIKAKDNTVFDELEEEVFGGGERFYQPLKDFLRANALKELKAIPYGIHSGLKRGSIKGIFFYYKYAEDFHFWYLYDLVSGELLKYKTQILNYIACPPEEPRIIPDFFERVYEINKMILSDIESVYKELEQKGASDILINRYTIDTGKKLITSIIREVDLQIDEYLLDFPEDRDTEHGWEGMKEKLVQLPLSKRREKELRRLWKGYKEHHKDWKLLTDSISKFVEGKVTIQEEELEKFDPSNLKLVAVDFIS